MENIKNRLLDNLDKINDLPVLPSVVFDVETALEDDSTSAEEVAEIIEEDPSITANILRTVNSVYYSGAAGKISRVKDAVARLGFGETSRLLMTFGILQTFSDFGKHLDPSRFWKHSLTTGYATRRILRYSDQSRRFADTEANIAGLLHDIGMLVMDQHFPSVFTSIQDAVGETDIPYDQIERRLIGIDHGEIGGHLLESWNLPKAVVEAIKWHHQPEKCEAEYLPLAEMVYLANIICHSLKTDDECVRDEESEQSEVETQPEINDPVLTSLGLSADNTIKIIEQVSQ